MKKWMSALSIILVGIFMLVGCSSSNEQTSTQNEQSKPSETSDQNKAETKTITLKSSIQSPPKAHLSRGFDAFLDEVEKISDGQIKFERYYSETLAKAADQLNALSTGIADISMFVPTYTPGKIPLATVSSNPALWADSWVGSKAYNEIYHTVPELQKELEGQNVKFVSQYATPTYYIISNKPVNSLEDVKGLKVIATGQLGVLAQHLGAAPVGIPITESFEAMERGTVDAVFYGVTSAATYGLEQSAKYVWKLPVGGSAGIIGFNINTWNSIPKDLQDKIMEIGTEVHPNKFHEIYQIQGDEEALQKFIDAGATITEASEEDLNKLKEIAKNEIWSEWVKDAESKGLPGQKVFDAFTESINKFEKENPYK